MKDDKSIDLFTIKGMRGNGIARSCLKQLDIEVVETLCPATMLRRFKFPFVKDETERGYYGIEAIKVFVSRRKNSLNTN